jgi:uncharacterized membrane protein YfcA
MDFILLLTAFMAGALNSVAGGGSFLTFPAMLLAGISPLVANATCTIVLWPASITSIVAYRKLYQNAKFNMWWLAIIGFVGGLAGAQTLLITSEEKFLYLVPWLLLIATLIFAFGKQIANFVLHFSKKYQRFKYLRLSIAVLVFLLTAFYGGFFGAGIGILTLSVLYIMGLDNIHQMNAIKSVLVVVINSAAFFTFVFSEIIAWDIVPLTILAAMTGSYLGAVGAMRLPQKFLRIVILTIASATTIYFFVK